MIHDDRGVFTKLESTRQFLFSKSAPHIETPVDRPAGLPDADPLIQAFPEVAIGDGFGAAVAEKAKQWDTFGALVIRIEQPADTDPGAIRIEDRRLALARVLARLCSTENGVWGVVDHRHLACVVEDGDETACLERARSIQQSLGSLGDRIIGGAAVYPTGDFERDQVLGNAFKALAHAEFLGPGSLVAFDAVSLNISGDNHYDAGDIAGAVKEYRKGLLLDPQNVNIHNSLGVCYGVLGEFDKALAEFSEAMRIDESEVMAVYNTGLTYILRDEVERGMEYLKKAVQIDDGIFEICLQLGRVCLEAGDAEDGRGYLEKALAIRPDSAAAHFFLGECHNSANRNKEAETAYQSAIKNDPNHAAALSSLGWLYDRLGENRDIALIFCEQSVKIAPDVALYHYRLGRLYLKHGRLDAARAALKAAADLGHDVGAELDIIEQPAACRSASE